MLTIIVMTNSTRPEAMRALRPVSPDSPKVRTMLAAKVLPPGSRTCQLIPATVESTRAIATVSPSARPRPSIIALIMPDLP
jgi:hypothetical protein